jgi:hypothetical protein
MSDELTLLNEGYIQDLEENGYIDKPNEVPRSSFVTQKMVDRATAARIQGKNITIENTGFKDISARAMAAARVDDPDLPFEPAMVPSNYLNEGGSIFILMGGHRLKQLYEDTIFGELLVDEFRDTELDLIDSNITIASEPATLSYTKYEEDQWATIIYAEKDGHMFIVEATSKLEGEDRDQFVLLVEDLMSASLLSSE